MSVCVRVDDDLVAEFRNFAHTVEKPDPKAVPSASVAQCAVSSADSYPEGGVATPETLAELQARSDEAVAAGCRVA